MKHLATKLVCIAVSIGIAFAAILLARVELHGAAGPLLYWNDRSWARESRQGIEKVYEIYYIPVTLFNQFDGVDVRTNKTFKTFIIENGDKYLSFDTVSDFALSDEGKRIYIKTFELHEDRYVPAKAVCAYLGLGYEQLTSAITGEVAIRITDGNQKNSFNELLKSKYPGFFEPETTAEASVSQTTSAPPQTSAPDTNRPVLTERTIFITVEDSPGEYTDELLELLSEFGFKATFFVVGDKAAEHPELLSRIAAEGHTVGLHTMSHEPAKLRTSAAILDDINAENELLAALIKQKSRIWRAPEGSERLMLPNDNYTLRLNQSGIAVWDFNVESVGRNAEAAAKAVIEGIWSYQVPIIRFVEGKDTAGAMRTVFEFIAENSDVCELRTISPAYYEYDISD